MTIEKLFIEGTRNKVRFPFRGIVSVEDLWDLSVSQLDEVYKALNSKLKQAQEESLLNTKTKEDKELDNKIEIVKYIVAVKLFEQEAHSKAKEQAEQKQKIMGILSRKQDEELHNMSAEELQKILSEMEN